ncbi:MAG: hypothetical protein ABI880_01645 [Acidobacteriota bacterium]
MRRLLAAVLALAVAAVPLPALAQPQADGPDQVAAINPEALGVSTARIKRRLAADSQARSQGASPLKLEYHVDVFGTAPLLRFFAGQDLVYGAVPGSAPTHRDMLDMFTPQAFKSPRVDFLGLALGAASQGAKKVQDWRYLRDLRNYQKLVESGVNVSAPQPPRK